jgi:hypothetical protein
MLICFVSFVPGFIVVSEIVGFVVYGEFTYAEASQIHDKYIDLPTDAREIVLHKYASGHAVKFQTSQESLEEWMNQVTESRRKYTDAIPFQRHEEIEELLIDEFIMRFEQYEWSYPSDVVVYRGWHSQRGAGFDVWFSHSNKTCYISAGYW